jgi:hypothetical protein
MRKPLTQGDRQTGPRGGRGQQRCMNTAAGCSVGSEHTGTWCNTHERREALKPHSCALHTCAPDTKELHSKLLRTRRA